MQRLILVALVVVLFGCAARPKDIQKQVNFYSIDFSRYADSGFNFSPYIYTGKHKPVGLYTLVMSPAAKYHDRCPDTKPECMSWEAIGWRVEKISIQEAIDSMYQAARAKGANSLVDIRINKQLRGLDPTSSLPEIEVSGFAIKRLD